MEVHPGERRKVELPEFGTNLFGIGSVSNRLRQYNKSIYSEERTYWTIHLCLKL